MFDKHIFQQTVCWIQNVINSQFNHLSGPYYKTITIVIMMIVSDATIWSVTYGHNWQR